MDITTIIGILASTLTAASLIPQLIKLLKEKKAQDVSGIMLAVLIAGVCMWIYYGILSGDLIIIIANSISLLINLTVAGFTYKFKTK